MLPVELPFTGTKGYISHFFFERPDVRRNEEYCLYPDFHIPMSMDERLNGIDTVSYTHLTLPTTSRV